MAEAAGWARNAYPTNRLIKIAHQLLRNEEGLEFQVISFILSYDLEASEQQPIAKLSGNQPNHV